MNANEPAPVVVPAAAGATGGLHPVAEVRAALGLLTRIPVRSVRSDTTGAPAFGIVGALVGLVASVPLVVIAGAEPVLGAVATVAVLAIVSGALHLDGVADTADALLAADPTRAEAARKDPAIGVGGVVAIVLVLAGEVAALASVASGAGPTVAALMCIAAGTASRALAVPLARAARHRVGPSGLGEWFASRVTVRDVIVSLASTVLVVAALTGTAAIAAPSAAVGFVVGIIIGAVVGLVGAVAIVTARGRLDGDGFGAGVEITQLAILGAVAWMLTVA